jgi:hypothetical protein
MSTTITMMMTTRTGKEMHRNAEHVEVLAHLRQAEDFLILAVALESAEHVAVGGQRQQRTHRVLGKQGKAAAASDHRGSRSSWEEQSSTSYECKGAIAAEEAEAADAESMAARRTERRARASGTASIAPTQTLAHSDTHARDQLGYHAHAVATQSAHPSHSLCGRPERRRRR